MRNQIIKPIPQENESPLGFILRCAEANGWKSSSSFLSAIGLSNNSSMINVYATKKKWWNKIVELTGVNTSATKLCYPSRGKTNIQAFIDFFGITVPKNHMRLTESAVCPKCLKDNGYAHAAFDHKLTSSCHIHNLRLITKCPNCKKAIKWNRGTLKFCTCGLDLSKSKTTSVSSKFSQFVWNIFNNRDDKLLEKMFDLSNIFHEYYQIIGKKKNRHDLAMLAFLFFAEIESFQAIVKKEVIYAATKRGIHPRLSLAPLMAFKNDSLIQISEKLLFFMRKYQIENKRYKINYYISSKHIQCSLGISKGLTNKLHAVNGISYKKKTNNSLWEHDADYINRLLILFSNKNAKIKNGLSIKTVINSPMHKGNFVSCISDIVKGKTKCTPMDIRKGVLSAKVKPIKSDPIDRGEVYSINDVAKICGVNYENIRFVIKTGKLKPLSSSYEKHWQYWIEISEAERFHNEYIFGGVVAKENFMNSTNMAEKLMALGAKPVSGPSIDGGLAYLFKREDISKVDFEKLLSLRNYPTRTGRKKGQAKTKILFDSVSVKFASKELNISTSKVSGLVKKGLLTRSQTSNREKRITKKSFNDLYYILEDKSLITLEEACLRSNETVHQFYKRWIHTNFVKLIDINIARLISKKDLKKVLKLKQKYITSSEGGELCQMGRTYLACAIRLGNIKVAKTLKGERTKLHLFLRKDVMKLKQDLLAEVQS